MKAPAPRITDRPSQRAAAMAAGFLRLAKAWTPMATMISAIWIVVTDWPVLSRGGLPGKSGVRAQASTLSGTSQATGSRVTRVG